MATHNDTSKIRIRTGLLLALLAAAAVLAPAASAASQTTLVVVRCPETGDIWDAKLQSEPPVRTALLVEAEVRCPDVGDALGELGEYCAGRLAYAAAGRSVALAFGSAATASAASGAVAEATSAFAAAEEGALSTFAGEVSSGVFGAFDNLQSATVGHATAWSGSVAGTAGAGAAESRGHAEAFGYGSASDGTAFAQCTLK